MKAAGFGCSKDARRRARAVRSVEGVTPASSRRVLSGFLGWLGERGLAGRTIEQYVSEARRFVSELVGRHRACVRCLRALTTQAVEDFLCRRRKALGHSSLSGLHCGLARFLEFCIERGWLPAEFLAQTQSLRVQGPAWSVDTPRLQTAAEIAKVRAPALRRVLKAYVAWLEEVRDLATSTIFNRSRTASLLLESWVGGQAACIAALRRLSVSDVEGLFVTYRQEGHGPRAQRALQAGMRCFLRFCAAQGWVPEDLRAVVPSIRTYRLSSVPRGVSESDLPSLLEAASSSSKPKRNRAIILILATYGVRRAQVSALRLRDLHWRDQRVVFPAHKGGRTVKHTLTPAVGEALADYLGDRPEDYESEYVFLRAKPPWVRLSPPAITCMVARLFAAAGVESHPRGPHAMRHAFAKRLLSAGQPLEVVADLLGHRSLGSVDVYAKVDIRRLSQVPLEWPEALR